MLKWTLLVIAVASSPAIYRWIIQDISLETLALHLASSTVVIGLTSWLSYNVWLATSPRVVKRRVKAPVEDEEVAP